jgi:LEA14-like dessication related protein
MIIKKKHIIAGLIGLVTITGATLYLQYQRLMNYTISLKRVKINKLSLAGLNVDLFLNFENKSGLKFIIQSQKYDIFVNNVFLITLQNDKPNEIFPNSVNTIGMNMNIDSKVIGKRLKDALLTFANTDKTKVKFITTLKVKFGVFTLSFPPFTYESTLKNMMQ